MTKKKLKITLKRSPIGCERSQRETLRALGLRKRHQSVEKANIPCIRGMVKKVIHLVEVDELDD